MTTRPWRSPLLITLSAISPRLAYMRMLRASSEIAAAMTVWSPLEKPAFAAMLRPCWRAVTTSTSDAIGTSSSSGTIDAPLAALDALAGDPVEEGQPFLEIERGRDALERAAELDHREGDLGLDPDDDGLGAAQAGHVRDVAQRANGKGVHYVQCRHVHDDAAGAEAPHPLDQRFPQLREVGIGQRRLDGRDEVLALFENRNFHIASAYGVAAGSRLRGQLLQRHDLIAQQPLRLLDATLQVADGRHLAQVHADRYERLGDLG